MNTIYRTYNDDTDEVEWEDRVDFDEDIDGVKVM